MSIPRLALLSAVLPLATLLLLAGAECSAQSTCRPMPPGLVVGWDADDIHYYAWHSQNAYALDFTDRIAGAHLVIAPASQSTADWGEPYVIANDASPRGKVFRTDWWNAGLAMSAADHSKLDFTNAMTVEFWFRSAGTQQPWPYFFVMDKGRDQWGGDATSSGFQLEVERANGRLYFRVGYSGVQSTVVQSAAGTNLLDGGWHHVAGTYEFSGSSGSMNLYIDGVLHQSASVSQPMVPNAARLNMASYGSNVFGPLFADYDGINFYDRAMSAAEIQAIHAANGVPVCRPMFPNRSFEHTIVVPGTTQNWVGGDLDIDGDLMVFSYRGNGGSSRVHIHRRPTSPGSPWNLETTFDLGGNRELATSSVSGDSVAAVTSDNYNTVSVYVWRYESIGQTWVAETGPAEWSNVFYLRLIALDGDTLAVSQDYWYQNGQPAQIDVFTRTAGVWSLQQEIPVRAESIALRGDILLVGYPWDATLGSNSGSVRVYRRSGSTWNLLQTILPNALEPGQSSYVGWGLGTHVAIDAGRFVAAASGRPAAYVLQLTGNGAALPPEGVLTPPTGVISFGDPSWGPSHATHGHRVAIEGDLVVVAASGEGQNGQGVGDWASPGSAYVFARDASGWRRISKLRHGYYTGTTDPKYFDCLALDRGRIYSVERIDWRIVESEPFSLPSSDTVPPTVAIAAPLQDAVYGTTTVTLDAAVTDEGATTVVSTPAGISAPLPAGGGAVSGVLPLLVEGENQLTITATDASGNVGGNSVTVIRDTIAPQIDVLSPPEGAIVSTTPATFSAVVGDATATTLAFGGNAIPVPPGGATRSGEVILMEGLNDVQFTATDAAGNVGTALRQVTLDLSAPVITIDSPADGACFGPGATPVAVLATVTDLTGTTASSVPPGVAGALPPGGGIVTGAVALIEGANTITVSATDATARTGSASIVVVLDTTPPVVSLISPSGGAAVRGTIDFDATANDVAPGSGVARVELSVGTNVVAAPVVAPFETTLDTSTLPDGWHTLTATGIDGKGNSASTSIQVRIDNTPPLVTIDSPGHGAVVSGTIAFGASATDGGSGVAALNVLAAGLPPTPTDGSTSFAPPVANGNAASLVDTTQFADGPLVLAAHGLDAAGNPASSFVTVQVDNQAPEKSLLAPADGAVVSGTIQIVAAAQDPNLASLTILVDGQVVDTSSTSPLSVSFDTTLRVDGPMAITVVATDIVNNSSSCSASVTVDNVVSHECNLHPETLNLKSKSTEKSVTLKMEGHSLGLLLPTESHSWQLRVPGGSPVPSTAGFAGDDQLQDGDNDTVPELTIKFDRQLLIAAIKAGVAAGLIANNSVIIVEVYADGAKICEDALRIIH